MNDIPLKVIKQNKDMVAFFIHHNLYAQHYLITMVEKWQRAVDESGQAGALQLIFLNLLIVLTLNS